MVRSSFTRTKRGFSLLELMVAVVIVSIISSVGYAKVKVAMRKVTHAELKITMKSIYTAQKAFYAEYETYNPRMDVLGLTFDYRLSYDINLETDIDEADFPTNVPRGDPSCVRLCGCSNLNVNCKPSGRHRGDSAQWSGATRNTFILEAHAHFSETEPRDPETWIMTDMGKISQNYWSN